jgi:hypothetical protein
MKADLFPDEREKQALFLKCSTRIAGISGKSSHRITRPADSRAVSPVRYLFPAFHITNHQKFLPGNRHVLITLISDQQLNNLC